MSIWTEHSWMCPMHINNIGTDQRILFPFYQFEHSNGAQTSRIWIIALSSKSNNVLLPDDRFFPQCHCPMSIFKYTIHLNAEVNAAFYIRRIVHNYFGHTSNKFVWSQHAIGFNAVVMYALVNCNKKKRELSNPIRFFGNSIGIYFWAKALKIVVCSIILCTCASV